ncbi:hypothetical protein BGZ60DRAFT_466204 [Tricladium varicosporioides]|nr:hypothetical protein BGZ60DRAFT_466204 [Hymenoscyphus varicosporioides]
MGQRKFDNNNYDPQREAHTTSLMGPSRVLRASETSTRLSFQTAFFPTLHLLSCLIIAICMLRFLDGYLAVSIDSPHFVDGGKFKLRVSDVTTLISAALIVVKLLVGAWTGAIVWTCVFILLEKRGLSLGQITRIMSFNIPPVPRGYAEIIVAVLLLLVIPQQFISPILSGAVDWSPSFEYGRSTVQVPNSDRNADPTMWFWYYYSPNDRRANVRRATALATLAWGESAIDKGHCRHVLGADAGNILTVNSSISNVVMPCIQIHSITFPNTPAPKDVYTLLDNSLNNKNDELSRVGDSPFQYFTDGNTVLFDPKDRPGMNDGFPPIHDNARLMDRPTNFLQNGVMNAAVIVSFGPPIDGKNCTNINTTIFGNKRLNNIFSPIKSGNYYRCLSWAIVNFTAGVTTSPTGTYISNRVVEADVAAARMDIRGGPWVKEALYLLPDIMSALTMMNTTSLNTWDDLEGYTSKVIRYSYQAAWDMLSRSFDPILANATFSARVYRPRVRASVSHGRVLAWLAVGALMTISAVLLTWGMKSMRCVRQRVFDGPVAALLTDPKEVIDGNGVERELTAFSLLNSTSARLNCPEDRYYYRDVQNKNYFFIVPVSTSDGEAPQFFGLPARKWRVIIKISQPGL